MFQRYKPSGRVGPVTLLLTLGGILIAIILAYFYQLLLDWIPLIYINFLLTLGAGFALGMIGSFVVYTGHCRNQLVGGLVGVLLATSFIGAKFWFQYRSILNQSTDIVIAENGIPADQWAEVRKVLATDLTFSKHIEFRVEQGWQLGRAGGGGGAPMAGAFVYLVWLVEAGVLLFPGVSMSVRAASQPYSEPKNAWADEEEIVMTLPINEPEMVSRIRTAGSVDELLEIPIPKSDESSQFAIYRVNSVPGEEMEDAYLSVDLLTISVNSRGEEEKKEESLVQRAILTSEKRQELAENASLLYEAMAEFRKALEEEQAAAADAESTANLAHPNPDQETPESDSPFGRS